MSPYLHYEIARARQDEIALRAINAHRHGDTPTTASRGRTIERRVYQAAAVIGVCIAAAMPVAATAAHPSHNATKPQHGGQVAAQQLARKIHAWELKGFVPTSCTAEGTRMRNYSTGQSVTVN
jgi:hypothetical protein